MRETAETAPAVRQRKTPRAKVVLMHGLDDAVDKRDTVRQLTTASEAPYNATAAMEMFLVCGAGEECRTMTAWTHMVAMVMIMASPPRPSITPRRILAI